MVERLEARGGEGGEEWDDGVFEAITKVYVGNDDECSRISFIKFEYMNEGEIETREHGLEREEPQEFELDFPNEHIVSIEGTYGEIEEYGCEVITSLTFKTSRHRISPTFGNPSGESFVLQIPYGKLAGFHGRSGDALDALGVYYVSTLNRLEPQGGEGGDQWDVGSFDRVSKVFVGNGANGCIGFIKFEGERGGYTETHEFGMQVEEPEEFELEHEHEYITRVEGTYDLVEAYGTDGITSLTFTTSTGRASPMFGEPTGTPFVLEIGNNVYKLVGINGRAGEAIDAIGGYFAL